MSLLGECGAGVIWVGEQGVRYYASGRALTRSSALIEAQAGAWANPRTRLAVARKMYRVRFPDEDPARYTRRELLGHEGQRVKECYRQESRRTGVPWHGRQFTPGDFTAGDADSFSDDAWDNYYAERNLVRDHLAKASNPVVITGDVHASYVADVKADFENPASATVATELVGTSIASGGNGVDQNPGDAVQLAENPHIKFINRKRGYVRNVITRDGWTAAYRTVDYVTQPGAPVVDKGTFVIEHGKPGARLI